MDVGNGNSLGEAGEAANVDVLADNEDLVVLLVLNGLAVAVGLSVKLLDVRGILLRDNGGDALDVLVKELVLGDEVGFGVYLNGDADAVDYGGEGNALGGYTAGLLLSGGETLLAEPLNGLVDISIGLGKGLLALHHAYAGHLAQVLYVSSCKCHGNITPFSSVFFLRKPQTVLSAVIFKGITPQREPQRSPRSRPQPSRLRRPLPGGLPERR